MTINKRKPFTPGEILLEEFMEPYGLTQVKLAKLTRMARRRINEIIGGKRAVTPDTAIRLGKLFGMSPDYWLNLQMKMDLWEELDRKKDETIIKHIKPLVTKRQVGTQRA